MSRAGSHAEAYDEISTEDLLPIAQLDEDAVRQKIDKAVGKALKIPDLSALRELLAREPGLSALGLNGNGEEEDDGNDSSEEDGD